MPAHPTIRVSRRRFEDLEKKVGDLQTLIEVSAMISSTLDFTELMSVIMEKAKKVMDAEACSILLYNRETDKLEFEVVLSKEETTSDILKRTVTLEIGEGIAGWVAEHRKPLIVADARTDSRFSRAADKQTGFETKSLVAVPLVGRRGLIGVAEVMNPGHKDAFDDYDLGIFQTLSTQVAVAIENAYFHQESLERERLRQELDIASAVQRSFLPPSPVFRKGNIVVSAVNMSARKVGGDIYDFIEPGGGNVGVLIGDVSGKGISAALYMAKTISDFRYTARHLDAPEVALKELNGLLSGAPMGMFLTAIYLIVDVYTGTLRVSAAGHPPPLWLSAGEVRVADIPAGPPLGILPADYPARAMTLGKGDRIVLLTDGVFDAQNRQGERLGFDRLVDFIGKHRSADRLLELIVDHVNDFADGVERTDDLTMVEIGWRGEEGGAEETNHR